jgi:hypothetical protein
MALHLGLLFGVIEVGGIREQGGVVWGSRVRPKLFTIGFLVCSIFVNCKFCPNSNGFKRMQDLEKLYLV